MRAQDGDGAALAEAVALIDSMRDDGLGLDEVTWTIGLARLLDPGEERERLVETALRRIDELGLTGFTPMARDMAAGRSV